MKNEDDPNFTAVTLCATQCKKKKEVKKYLAIIHDSINKAMNPLCPAGHRLSSHQSQAGANVLTINSSLSWQRSLLNAVRSVPLSTLSRLVSLLPRHRSEVHVCKRDSERNLHPHGLHTLL